MSSPPPSFFMKGLNSNVLLPFPKASAELLLREQWSELLYHFDWQAYTPAAFPNHTPASIEHEKKIFGLE